MVRGGRAVIQVLSKPLFKVERGVCLPVCLLLRAHLAEIVECPGKEWDEAGAS